MACGVVGPVLRDSNGNIIYEFSKTFLLDGRPRRQQVPSLAIGGRDGAVTEDRMIREEPRTITISGPLLDLVGDDDIRDLEDEVMSKIAGEEVFLSASEDDDRYIKCYYTDVSHAFVDGWNYDAAQATITFRADDPFWYHVEEFEMEEEKTVDYDYTLGDFQNFIHGGTAQGGGVDTITLSQDASDQDGEYEDMVVRIVSSTGEGQKILITDYVGSTREATVVQNWTTEPDSTSEYEIYERELRWIIPGLWPADEMLYRDVDLWNPGPLNVDIENRGNAPASPLIRITAIDYGGNEKAINPVLTNNTNGMSINFDGELHDGDYIEYNAGRHTAVSNGDNVLSDVNTSYILQGFRLEPGNNSLHIEWDSDTDATARIELRIIFRERWY